MPEEMKQAKDVQKNKMGQGSPKQHEYKPNHSTGLLELSRRKVYSRPKGGLEVAASPYRLFSSDTAYFGVFDQ